MMILKKKRLKREHIKYSDCDKINYNQLNVYSNALCSHCDKIVVYRDFNNHENGLMCWECPECELSIVSYNKGVEN